MLKTGDILLFKPTNIFTKIIAKLSRSEYSHAGVVYGDLHGKKMMFDIDWTKSKIAPIDYDRDFDVYRPTTLSDPRRERLKGAIINMLNKQYDYIQLVGFLNRLYFRSNKIFNNPNKFVCSEIVDVVFDMVGIDLLVRYKKGNVTPQNLADSILTKKIMEFIKGEKHYV